MAQRKPPTTPASRKATPRSAPAKRPPAKKKPGKSIVNQKQTPWGLIAIVAVVVVFAAGIIVYAVVHNSSKTSANGGGTKKKGEKIRHNHTEKPVHKNEQARALKHHDS